ncbi:hypothetical protein GXW71_33580 [Roseomonas hellenica]|uniref:Uncharacterized protein n=1 Tax=Plastoroseomonas hellenica TaxID=2687306 RepID=A0ABS5FB28_9PROT|nr:hypothetical protein [Plastoroseomonas hellenica]MBR0669330.1 hypothetical protein [Plastoroseomonas hellenica]
MSDDVLDIRRRALEEAFFARQDAELIHRLRTRNESGVRKQALSAASGIIDDALLEKLVASGIESDTLAALTLVPLVAVAWADGSLDEKERAALLSAASGTGLDPAGPGYQLLTQWLAKPPGPHLLETWTDYIRGTSANLEEDARHTLQLHVLGRARRVAEAAGGFLGLAPKVSAAEEAMLEKLEGAFAR